MCLSQNQFIVIHERLRKQKLKGKIIMWRDEKKMRKLRGIERKTETVYRDSIPLVFVMLYYVVSMFS